MRTASVELTEMHDYSGLSLLTNENYCAFLVYREKMEVMFMVSNVTVFGCDGLWQ